VSPGRPRLGVRTSPRIARRSANALLVGVLAAVVGAGVLAGCGGGGSSSSGAGSTAATKTTTGSESIPVPKPPPNAEEGTVFVSLSSAAGLGQVLVDAQGHTLYAFSKDSGERSACTGRCAKAWPPLLVAHGEPEPSNGAGASRLGTITLPGGKRQVTYAGHPLYSFIGDKQPGQANGNGSSAFGGTWTALKGSGAPAR
jgi:predicted lipoprotein with Yx(FWY)xxD motif